MNNRKKIIFLDIDGVLNGYNYINITLFSFFSKIGKLEWIKKRIDIFGIHRRKVILLHWIVKLTGAKIVMSSSWRGYFWKVPFDQKDIRQKRLESMLNRYHIEVIDITPTSPDYNRGNEIITWLSRHENEVDSFVILDDERRDLEILKDRLVLTSALKPGQIITGKAFENTGLHIWHVFKAVHILNKERLRKDYGSNNH